MQHYRRYLVCACVAVGLVTGSLSWAAEEVGVSTPPDITTTAVPAPVVVEATPAASSRVNINTATMAELMTIKGVGLAKAKAIIDYRTAHGSFTSVDDLAAVAGIGQHRLKQMAGFVTVK